jgi:putative phage-type endonuclease
MAMRKSGIGASEISAVCNMNRFRTALDVYMRKRGLVDDSGGNNATRAGNYLEDGVGRWAADRMGWRLHKVGRTFRHREHRWMLSTPDRQVVTRNGRSWKREALAEIKTTAYPDDWGTEGTDEIPVEYRLQCQQQLSVMRSHDPTIQVNYVPVLFFNRSREHRIYRVDHSPELEDAIVEAGERFWVDHVLTGEPPEFDRATSSAAQYIAAVTKQETAEVVDAPPAGAEWAAQLVAANAALAAAKGTKAEAEYHLRELVGENRGIAGDWGRYLWYTTKSGGTDWQGLCREMFAMLRAGGVMDEKAQAKLIGNHQRPGSRRPKFTPRKD